MNMKRLTVIISSGCIISLSILATMNNNAVAALSSGSGSTSSGSTSSGSTSSGSTSSGSGISIWGSNPVIAQPVAIAPTTTVVISPVDSVGSAMKGVSRSGSVGSTSLFTYKQESFVGTTSLPAGIGSVSALVTNSNYKCPASGSNKVCYVQYTATPGSNSSYNLSSSTTTLACPSGYVPMAYTGNAVAISGDTSSLTSPVYYYNAINASNLSTAQLADYNLMPGMTVTANKVTSPNVSRQDITDGTRMSCCEPSIPQTINVNGGVAYASITGSWEQDTWMCNSGAQDCQHYALAGCPSSCARATVSQTDYFQTSVSRPAGLYHASVPDVIEDGSARGSLYTPSIVVCGAVSFQWQ